MSKSNAVSLAVAIVAVYSLGHAMSVSGQQPAPSPSRAMAWEYQAMTVSTAARTDDNVKLNALAADGWEVSHCYGGDNAGTIILKRAKKS